MTKVITNFSSSLLLKSHELSLQQSYSNAVREIARQMNVEFIDFNGFGDVYEIRSDLYGDNVRKAVWKEKSRPVILRSVPGYSEYHHRKLIEEVRFIKFSCSTLPTHYDAAAKFVAQQIHIFNFL